MKRIVLFLIAAILVAPCVYTTSEASLVSDKTYKSVQNKDYKKDLKQIKQILKVHNILANKHDLDSLKLLYSENFINNDGFNKELYFKNVKETWDECKDLTYNVKVVDIQIKGDYASVAVEETATGTVFESVDDLTIAGEIHSKSTGIYHLSKSGGKWLFSGETLLTDESSLLYGEARFMNIKLFAPDQIGAGDSYTAAVKAEADENTFIIASIEHDPVTYPALNHTGPLRALPKSNILERIMNANNDNINEYAVASLAISKTQGSSFEDYKIYMAGLACLMKRINVIPKNNFLEVEDNI